MSEDWTNTQQPAPSPDAFAYKNGFDGGQEEKSSIVMLMITPLLSTHYRSFIVRS